MKAGNPRLSEESAPGESPLTRFHPSHIHKVRACQQVAAVCYRVGRRGIEFLLVQTRGGHWTFPKGGVEPGLTHAQTAALEAYEEAGVHGRMEEAAFAQYTRRPRGGKRNGREAGLRVHAHLCQVLRLGPPQESRRRRTWFSPEKAKARLCEGRTSHDGAEFARVVDTAVARIQQAHRALRQQMVLPAPGPWARDPLQCVRLEGGAARLAYGQVIEASFLHYVRTESLEAALAPATGEETGWTGQTSRTLRRLAAASSAAKVIAIDEARFGAGSKPVTAANKPPRP
ncbi:MAG: NUDIX domain-containing protein [Acidobacteria bacterium]|nr:NUDIX domain-containing protein [Acidobacteriota bacterium]